MYPISMIWQVCTVQMHEFLRKQRVDISPIIFMTDTHLSQDPSNQPINIAFVIWYDKRMFLACNIQRNKISYLKLAKQGNYPVSSR